MNQHGIWRLLDKFAVGFGDRAKLVINKKTSHCRNGAAHDNCGEVRSPQWDGRKQQILPQLKQRHESDCRQHH